MSGASWEWLGRLVRRSIGLQLGYETNPIHLTSGTPSYTSEDGQVIYAFVSLSSANEIDTAVDVDGNNVLAGDIPPQGYEVKCRLNSITFDAITGTVLVYVKNLKDEL